MQQLAQELWARDPAYVDSDASLGELAWIWGAQHALDADGWTQRIWFDRDQPRAWGWIFRENLASTGAHPARLVWQVHPDRLPLLEELLDWFEAETPEESRHTSARQVNHAALEILGRRGYAPADGEPFGLMNARGLDGIEEPVLPPGYRLRTMDEIGDRNATDGSVLTAPLESNRGAQRYPIDQAIEPTEYRTIIIHCQQYSKYWAGGPLTPTSEPEE